jgi:pimeloyl-ACP methyl ester carboxylesterase
MSDSPEQLSTRTDDGLRLSIDRYAPEGDSRGAIVLQHGLGSNNRAFVVPGVSLAEHLSSLGYDVYVPELRGAGRSDRPRSWSLDDYVEQDIPAILRAVLQHSGQPNVSWVGHSMGGILLMMYGIEHPELPVERFVAVGSSLDYTAGKNVYGGMMRLLPVMGALRALPFDRLAQLSAPVSGRGPLLPVERMNFWRSNVDREVMLDIITRGFTPIPIELFRALSSTFEPGGFSRAGGSVLYLPQAERFQVPSLLIGGEGDAQCDPEAVAATARLLSGAPVQHLAFGKSFGHADHYGHFDLLVGKRAPQEVWPHITRFLQGDQHDASAMHGAA